MPRYFFHIDGASRYVDLEGIELADDDAAWSTAIVSMAELLKELDGNMPDSAQIDGTVTGSDEQVFFTLRFTGERHRQAG